MYITVKLCLLLIIKSIIIYCLLTVAVMRVLQGTYIYNTEKAPNS